MTVLNIRGFAWHKGFLDPVAQREIVSQLRDVIRAAPLFSPHTGFGKQMSVRMTSAGSCGWYADQQGYRYTDRHPSGVPWPPIPQAILEIWQAVSGVTRLPDSCLVNFYESDAKMGMHQDKDEANLNWPVVSISLGDAAVFRIGNLVRGGKTETVVLESGDVMVMGGDARLAYHGVDHIRFGSSSLLPKGGRINLTLRVAK